MAQSLSKIYVHLVFHKKYSSVAILEKDLPKLFAYIDGIIVNNKGFVIQIGGIPNHVHILCSLPRTITVAKFVEDIKRCSSKWIKTLSPYYSDFAWQGGYSIFSVNASHYSRVKEYIINQKEHHRNQSFEEEYIALLKAYNIEYDEDYLLID